MSYVNVCISVISPDVPLLLVWLIDSLFMFLWFGRFTFSWTMCVVLQWPLPISKTIKLHS